MNRIVGIETEYGFFVENKGAEDQVMEAMKLVRAFPGLSFHGWDYSRENPRKDMRGFSVKHLSHDPEDAKFESMKPTRLSDYELKSDRLLVNSARLYNDHGHPEYSTPECLSLFDLIAHDKAGEQIMRICAAAFEKAENSKVHIYKNNSDFHGASYGTHENYLFPRDIEFEKLLRGLLPFFVTRIIYAGAGKVGSEADSKKVPFQLSQRADFFMEESNVETLFKRPIINTRDEQHSNAADWRRLHVICGDANMSEYSTALKCGTTSLVLTLIENGWQPAFQIKDPVKAIKSISQDQTWKWLISRDDGSTITACDVQREYLNAAEKQLRGRDQETDWILDEWKETIEGLEKNPLDMADRLDWAAKRNLLESYLSSENIGWDSDLARSLDLEYHNIEPTESLYYLLESEGSMQQLVTQDAVDLAMNEAPRNTRARIRQFCIEKYRDNIETISWSKIVLKDDSQTVRLNLEPLVHNNLKDLILSLEMSSNITEFVEAFNRGTHDDN